MDLIRYAMTNRRLATERLHDDYRKIYKNHQFAYIIKKKSRSVGIPTFNNSLMMLL